MPECFEAFEQAMGRANGVAFVEVVRAEILVGGGGPVEHVAAGAKDRIGDRDQRRAWDRAAPPGAGTAPAVKSPCFWKLPRRPHTMLSAARDYPRARCRYR